MILDRLLYVSHQVTQLMPRARGHRNGDDTCAVLTLDRRRCEGLLYTPQLREAHSLTLRGIDNHILHILQGLTSIWSKAYTDVVFIPVLTEVRGDRPIYGIA